MRKKYKRKIRPVRERFEEYLDRTNDCWLWVGPIDSNGYGRLGVGKKAVYAHRLSYEFYNGSIPKSKNIHEFCVLHKCDNPKCVNPDHLFLGTQLENIRDRVNKKRTVAPRGEDQHLSKLTEKQVLEIRAKYIPESSLGAKDGYSIPKLSKEYSVDNQVIWSIINRKLGCISND